MRKLALVVCLSLFLPDLVRAQKDSTPASLVKPMLLSSEGEALNTVGACLADNIRLKPISVDDGLSQNLIYTILQDHRGFMWFGTERGGLNLYDRDTERFQRFRHDRDEANSISANTITAIAEDANGGLWVGTRNGGLNKLIWNSQPKTNARSTFRLVRYPNGPTYIESLLIDRAGTLWIATGTAYILTANPNAAWINQYPRENWLGEANLRRGTESFSDSTHHETIMEVSPLSENHIFIPVCLQKLSMKTPKVSFGWSHQKD